MSDIKEDLLSKVELPLSFPYYFNAKTKVGIPVLGDKEARIAISVIELESFLDALLDEEKFPVSTKNISDKFNSLTDEDKELASYYYVSNVLNDNIDFEELRGMAKELYTVVPQSLSLI